MNKTIELKQRAVLEKDHTIELHDDLGINADTVVVGAVNIGGHRVVVLDGGKAIYADKDTPGHINKVYGISIGAGSIGQNVTIRTYGKLEEVTWNWIPDRLIFLGNNGLLTQTPPTTGFRCPVAFPLTSTVIHIDIKESIQLG